MSQEACDAMNKADQTGKQRRRQAYERKPRIERSILEEMNAPIDVPSDEDVQEQMALNASFFTFEIVWSGWVGYMS